MNQLVIYSEEELKRKLSSIDITLTYLNGTFWEINKTRWYPTH